MPAPSLLVASSNPSLPSPDLVTSLNLVLSTMLSHAVAAATLLLATANAQTTACASTHLILARGTTEGYPGTLRSMAELIVSAVPGTTYEDVIYPATDETSTDSYHEGISNATIQLTAYANACPDAKIVLIGYSQGAMVIGDMLAGGGDGGNILGNYTLPTIDPETIGSRVTGLVMYGDPRHTPDQIYNVGNGTYSVTGKYPRANYQVTTLENYASRYHDYCNAGDPVCASGDNIAAHLQYASIWDEAAAAWVKFIVTA
ncbi:carbohydrate esterase family 5 protein [Dactylonectria macrodidyma]|uniref:Carbohydrate esterase family 5 protein n=1 Tax=Dactylonectria macrodidyma TaxID=307937 RepID=A0A9P9JIZ8_9HYPO|nr:carbohydrate esterase family 5 protein [Dactylonectria macrodidyma]